MSAKLKLTPGEALYLRRRRDGLNQVAAAAKFGAHPDIYREWERDERTANQPHIRASLGSIKPREHCVILRRRAGLKQRELAVIMEITRLWVLQMENGIAPADRLIKYWGL